MKTKRFLILSHDLCLRAVLDAFDKKWFRKDYLAVAEKYGGVTRAELKSAARNDDVMPRLEAADGIAYEMEQRIEDLLEGEAEDLDLDPVRVFHRIDGISMKRRELSCCCPLHQCFGHLAVLGMEPLLRAKLLPYQFASIPGKGQVALKRQVERWLRRKSLNVQYAVKLDVEGAYAHTKKDLVLKILSREMPKASWIIAVVGALLSMSKGPGLLIGGYLEAWLFNLVASYMLVKAMSYAKIRRGEIRRFVIRCGSYMDDLVLFGRRWADLQSAARQLTKWALSELGLTIKDRWTRVDFLSATEEHCRRRLTGAARGCPGLDMAGYVMHRTYTTIRPKIFLRARRQFLRAASDASSIGHIPSWRAFRLVSYNGYFTWTKSRKASVTLNVRKLFAASRLSIRIAAKKKVRITA